MLSALTLLRWPHPPAEQFNRNMATKLVPPPTLPAASPQLHLMSPPPPNLLLSRLPTNKRACRRRMSAPEGVITREVERQRWVKEVREQEQEGGVGETTSIPSIVTALPSICWLGNYHVNHTEVKAYKAPTKEARGRVNEWEKDSVRQNGQV